MRSAGHGFHDLEQGVSLTGSSPAIFAETMQNLGVDVVGTNCSLGPDQDAAGGPELLENCACPVAAEPNAGLPELHGNVTVFPLGPEEFAQKQQPSPGWAHAFWAAAAAPRPGIWLLAQAVRGMGCRPPEAARRDGICLTSRSQLVRIGADEPLVIIGERINPTAKRCSPRNCRKDADAALQLADNRWRPGPGCWTSMWARPWWMKPACCPSWLSA